MFHYNLRHSPHLVHRDFSAPSSLVLAVRNGEQEFFCKLDCNKQQLGAIFGINQGVEAKAVARQITDNNQEIQDLTMVKVDKHPDNTSDCSPMRVSNPSPSRALSSLPLRARPVHSDGEDSESCVSGSEDDAIDEVVSRLCDTFLGYCRGPLRLSRTNVDSVSQALGSAMTDLVLELFNQLADPPQMNQCAPDGVSSSACNPGYGASSSRGG